MIGMYIIGTPEADDCNKRMIAHSMISNKHYSVSEECKRWCEYGVITSTRSVNMSLTWNKDLSCTK